MSEKITPTCRYGHGPLNRDKPDTNHYWAVMGAVNIPLTAMSPVNKPISDTQSSNLIYTVNLYRCETCGYIELFDDEIDNG